MASIAEHTSTIRNILKQYNQPLLGFNDSVIYSAFARAAALLQTRTLEKGSRQSWFNTKTFCVKLIEDVSHPCKPCVAIGCKVLKSVQKIPRVLQVKNRDVIRVSTLDGKELHLIQPYERDGKMQDEFFENVKMATFINDHLIVYSKQKPSTVLVSGLFEDITTWSDYYACDEQGEETGEMCYNPLTEDYPLDSDLVFAAYQMTLDLLGVNFKIPDTTTNNANNQA